MRGPHRRFAPLLSHTLRRIPQAVGVIATCCKPFSNSRQSINVSIPQAAGVVATSKIYTAVCSVMVMVSIPQAVGIVATTIATKLAFISALRFQYRRR